jgi:uncharacterized phage-associated protein
VAELQFEFDMQKAVEVILYIAKRIPEPTFMKVLKLMFFADKTSLESYGRFICGDTYVAMEHGPVPSNSYDIMKAARDSNNYGFAVEYERHIKPSRDANLDELSESDIVCLDRIIELYGKYPAWHLRQISHDDEAYVAAWEQTGGKGSVPIPVENIICSFDNADELLDYLQNRHTD